MFSSLLSVIFILLIVIGFLFRKKKSRNFPPGPPNLPIVGSVPYLLGYNGVLDTFFNLTKKYGPILGYISNGRPKVILGDADMIRKIFSLPEVTSRPPQGSRGKFRYGQATGPVRGVLFSSGHEWKEQRNFLLKSLGELGMGKSALENKIWTEAIKLRDMFAELEGNSLNLNLMMNIAVVNTLWSISVSKTLNYKDKKVRETIQKIDNAIKVAGHMHPLTLMFPFLAKSFPKWFGIDQMDVAVSSIKELIDEHILDHKEAFNDENIKDILDKYMLKRREAFDCISSTFFGCTGHQNQQIVLMDLFLAGVETTTTSLLWAILFLLHHPEVQDKMIRELTDVDLESDGIRNASEKIPYTNAVMKEVLRCSSIVFGGIPHYTTKPVTVNEYTIPTGTTVIANVAYCMHDPNKWDNPGLFDPERFLRDPENPNFIPFLVGRRFCLGKSLGETQLLIFLTTLVKSFKFVIPEGQKLPSYQLFPKDGSLTSRSIIRYAPSYKVCMIPRSM